MQLVTEMKFVSQILLPAIDVQREIFQQDNARPHTARLTMDYLQYQNITVIARQLQSLDLNPIEHLLGELDRGVRQCQPRSQTIQLQQQTLQHKRQRILQVKFHRLIESMSRGVRTVLQVSGVQDRY